MYRGKPLGTCKGRVMCIKGHAKIHTWPFHNLCPTRTICVLSHHWFFLFSKRRRSIIMQRKSQNFAVLFCSFWNFTVVQKLLLPPLPYGSLPNNLLNRVQHKNTYFKTAKVIGLLVKSIIQKRLHKKHSVSHDERAKKKGGRKRILFTAIWKFMGSKEAIAEAICQVLWKQ